MFYLYKILLKTLGLSMGGVLKLPTNVIILKLGYFSSCRSANLHTEIPMRNEILSRYSLLCYTKE